MERFWKRFALCHSGNGISCTPPDLYASRFLLMIYQNFQLNLNYFASLDIASQHALGVSVRITRHRLLSSSSSRSSKSSKSKAAAGGVGSPSRAAAAAPVYEYLLELHSSEESSASRSDVPTGSKMLEMWQAQEEVLAHGGADMLASYKRQQGIRQAAEQDPDMLSSSSTSALGAHTAHSTSSKRVQFQGLSSADSQESIQLEVQE